MPRQLFVKDLMAKYNKTYHQVTYALMTGRIPAQKFGWIWIIDPSDLPEQWPIKRKQKGD